MTDRREPQRRRWRDAIYDAAQELLDDDPNISATALAHALDERFEGDAPAATTIRDWLRAGVIKPRVTGDYWTIAGSSGEEARLVLPAIAFLVIKTGRRHPRLTISRARWIAKLRTVDPAMPVGAAVVLSRLYEAHERLGLDTSEVDRYLALTDWTEWGDDGSRPPIDAVWLSEAGRSARRG